MQEMTVEEFLALDPDDKASKGIILMKRDDDTYVRVHKLVLVNHNLVEATVFDKYWGCKRVDVVPATVLLV